MKEKSIPNKKAEIEFILHSMITLTVQQSFQGVSREIDEVVKKFKNFLRDNVEDNISSEMIGEIFGQNAQRIFDRPGEYIPDL